MFAGLLEKNELSTKCLMFQALFFLQRILQEIMKNKKILGTSDAWSLSRLSHRPSKQAYYIEDCRIYREDGYLN